MQVQAAVGLLGSQRIAFGGIQDSTQVPLLQFPLQQSPEVLQEAPFGRPEQVVVVVGVSVVAGVWQVPLTQTRLPQHCGFLVQCLPVRLHPGGAPAASPMPSDPSLPPTRAAPINLRALPRERLPSASPLARSSKKLSSLAIGRASSQNGGAP